MAFCRLVLPFLVLSVVSCYESHVPVFIWGNSISSSQKSYSLSTSPEKFEHIIRNNLSGEPKVVVFLANSLSNEDISEKDDDGSTIFPYLHSKLGKAQFLPSVENPLEVLSELIDPNLFVKLEDVQNGEPRSAMLKRHDKLMKKTIKDLEEQYGNVVAIYTAEKPSETVSEHSRVRRAADNAFTLNGLLLNLGSVSVVTQNETNTLTAFTSSSSEINSDAEMSATLVYPNDTSIVMHFTRAGGYWFFDAVNLTYNSRAVEGLRAVDEDVYAAEGFSYRCAVNVRFAANDYLVNFNNLKVQPFFNNTRDNLVFGESFNCVGFFTASIWAGLMVVFIMLAITFYGIMMMMDIKTMDRFDDPKGKTITINASE